MRRTKQEVLASSTMISRRALVVGAAQVGMVGMLGMRMHQLQVKEADQFRMLAEENRINMRLLPPARGTIFDVNGLAVASNEPSYRVSMVRADADDPLLVLKRLQKIIRLDDDDIERALAEMKSAPSLQVTIADRLTWEEMSRVAVNTPSLPGITAEVGLSRNYPLDHILSHVVGYVGPVSKRDLERREDPDPLLRIPRFQIGKIGVEAKLEDLLRGKAGTKRVEVNSIGRVIRELDRVEGEAGATVQLSVDAKLQDYILARLGEESASVVVMDVETGDLRAIASAPSFDPNKFVRGISFADYGELRDNNHRPLATKTVQDGYPPGSTFKMITALAALQANAVTPEESFYCPGHLEVGGRKFHCWKRSGHGRVNLETSLRESCDVYYYELALRVGIEKIAEVARKFGMDKAHDLPMSAISSGTIPDKLWKKEKFDKDWVIGDTVNASIGQGYVLTSPLQLAVMTARIASGRALAPRLVRSINGVEQPIVEDDPLEIDEQHLRAIRRAMGAVINDRRGTAHKSRIADDDKLMAGKTGTAQVRNISARERETGVLSNDQLAWELRDHALFVAFAPLDKPKYAVSVVVEHGGGGSAAAAPIARDVLLQALYDGTPPLSAYPSKDHDKIEAQQQTLEKLMRTYTDKKDRA